MADTYDVVVIGAGPAGATAATLLAKQGRATVLLDRSAFPRSGVCAGWLSTRAVPILESMGLPVDSILQHPFTDVAFYNADCSRVAVPVFSQPPGFLIDRTAFNNTLVASAQSAGVQLDTGTGVISLDRLENSVVANLQGGRSIVARQLILASGGGRPCFMRRASERHRGAPRFGPVPLRHSSHKQPMPVRRWPWSWGLIAPVVPRCWWHCRIESQLR